MDMQLLAGLTDVRDFFRFLLGRGATSDLSPQSAPKRTLTASPSGRVKIGCYQLVLRRDARVELPGCYQAVQRESRYEIEENKARRYCLWQEWEVLALPVSGLAWRKLRTWRRSGPEKTGQAEVWAGRQSRSMGTLDEAAGGNTLSVLGG